VLFFCCFGRGKFGCGERTSVRVSKGKGRKTTPSRPSFRTERKSDLEKRGGKRCLRREKSLLRRRDREGESAIYPTGVGKKSRGGKKVLILTAAPKELQLLRKGKARVFGRTNLRAAGKGEKKIEKKVVFVRERHECNLVG